MRHRGGQRVSLPQCDPSPHTQRVRMVYPPSSLAACSGRSVVYVVTTGYIFVGFTSSGHSEKFLKKHGGLNLNEGHCYLFPPERFQVEKTQVTRGANLQP